MDILCLMTAVACLLVPSLKVSVAVDSIRMSQSMSDGSKTLVSKGGTFELGFFSPGNSSKRYLGIWYKSIPDKTVVWVANRANLMNGSSGTLTVNSTGNLVLTQNGTIVWYTTCEKQAQNPVAELLETGNFVVRNEEEAEGYLWQSFDYPCDTFLPGMKLGWDLRNGMEWRLTSWKSPNDPSPGELHRVLVLHSYPEFYLMNGTKMLYRFGPWNGLNFSGRPIQNTNSNFYTESVSKIDYQYVSNKDELFITWSYRINNNSLIFRRVISQTFYQAYVWINDEKSWRVYSKYPQDLCDHYGLCGANANCRTSKSPVCQCLKGFSPKSPKAWNSSNWTQGCVRNKPLSCNNKHNDGFVKLASIKVPDTRHTSLDENIDLDLCRVKCLSNCTCMAYTNSDIRGAGSGCVLWFGDLVDLRQIEQGGQDIYIRMATTQLEPQTGSNSKKNKRTIVAAATTIPASCGMLLLCIYFIYRFRTNDAEKSKTEDDIETHVDVLDLPFFDLLTIITATNNFLITNKIGQGGFGPVYKGKLADGQEIAVKRLSRSSGQGITEFINEVKLIVKLQHRNLVRLLGCCIQEQERLLVYEYMANGSLDSFIFDHNKGKLLKWPRRFHIIFGIARGLLYLHQDSRLRIIHRDLKASNVLLDDKLNPKISDFGMAKAFGGDQTEGGYMAPEYAVDGFFSTKSDVFSFGILLLEMICGNKNRALCHGNQTLNLVGYAWTLWKEDKALQLIDLNIKDSFVVSEVLRCIHISLLCVQQYPEDRPAMTSVLQMLGSEMELLKPKEPGFFPKRVSDSEVNLCSDQNDMSTNDELTVTSLNGR